VPRQRSRLAIANDDAIRNAAIELILSTGIDAISFRDVGKRAGLSHGALYARFEDVEELLVDLWNEVLCHRVISLFEASRKAALLPSDGTVAAVLQRVREAEQVDVAAVQVLLLSRRFTVLREEVDAFVHDYLETIPSNINSAIWSRTMTLFSLVMVKIFSNSEFGLNADRLKFMQPVLTATLRTDPSEVPPYRYVEADESDDGSIREDLRSQLAYSTYGAVGASGYTRATISRISRRANCSPGAIYKLFSSKDELVVFAARRIMSSWDESPSRLAGLLDVGVLAQSLHDAASSRNNLRKYFLMEMMLASTYNAMIRDAVGAQLQRFESVADSISGIDDVERTNMRFMIREISLLTLGANFLSTVTSSYAEIDFVQFTGPFRMALLDCCFPSWSEIRRQLLNKYS
jgi:AcrR family transcriptional regulator